MKYHISTQEKKNDAIRQMLNLPTDGSHTVNIDRTAKLRTGKQNNTLWLWLTHIADEFNKIGQTIKVGALEILPYWDKEYVCDTFLRPILLAFTGDKTTKTTIDKLSECINYMADGLERAGHNFPVPSKEQLENGK